MQNHDTSIKKVKINKFHGQTSWVFSARRKHNIEIKEMSTNQFCSVLNRIKKTLVVH